MLKIKVNLDELSYNKLIMDMKSFRIQKKDGSPNKNKFMNLLFCNYYEEFNNEIESIIKNTSKIMNKYRIDNNDFANELVFNFLSKDGSSLETYYTKSLTFYLSDENEFIFHTINNIFNQLGDSSYFRKLIHRYLEYPQYRREQILYKNICNAINNAIKNKQTIKIKLEKTESTLNPYTIGTSKEELYSYLLGVNPANEFPFSIHLSKIKAVIALKDTFTLSKEITNHLDLIIKLGIQYPFKNLCKAEIELNNIGIKKYNSKYLNRPDPVRMEGNHYFFECSFEQLSLYFSSFGGNIKIISPEYLGKCIYKLYKSYTNLYEAINNHIPKK